MNKRTSRFFAGHPVVFPVASGLILLFVLLGALAPAATGDVFNTLQAWITTHFGWFYVLSMTLFLAFALMLAIGPYGRIRLGPNSEKPEFHMLTWLAMLFSAGMGIGLLFWSVAEPIYHFNHPPFPTANGFDAARQSMAITIFHWGLHPWGLYAMVGLALAYFGFRRGLPLSFRSVFFPLLGERIHGRLGDLVDILAVVATLFGVATSLGLGAMQVNAGLNHLFGLQMNTTMQVVIILAITLIATGSVMTGLHLGIRRLSEANMLLALGLMIFVFLLGPTVFFLNAIVENLGSYLQRLPTHAFWTGTFEDDEATRGWLGGWTVFYWGWWIAWSPFVGMFIARISRGRTIRQFITGVLIVPTAISIIWLTIFGSGALHQELYPDSPLYEGRLGVYPVKQTRTIDGVTFSVAEQGGLVGPAGGHLQRTDNGFESIAGRAVSIDSDEQLIVTGVVDERTQAPLGFMPTAQELYSGPFAVEKMELSVAGYLSEPVVTADHLQDADAVATALFVMLEAFPLIWLTALVATLCIVLFFVTSSDSASLVIDIIASGGREDPPVFTRVFWALLEGLVAAILLIAGGLAALQTASITAALPFTVVIVLMCFSLLRGLSREMAGTIPLTHKQHIAGEKIDG